MAAAFKTFADSTAKSWSTLGEDAEKNTDRSAPEHANYIPIAAGAIYTDRC